MTDNGAVNIDERAAQWKQEGFMPTPNTASTASTMPATATAATTAKTTAATTPQNLNANTGEVTLPVVEEEIQVGKREVQRGGVRVYTHMTETPVDESVQLREEHVTVDRRPVNRPVDEQELAAFKEGTIEVTEWPRSRSSPSRRVSSKK